MDTVKPITMEQDLFTNLPSQIIIGILSTLPMCTIIRCKCVCKSWLALLESPEFINSHVLNAIPGLAVYTGTPKLYNIFEFEDELNLEHHELHYNFVTQINLPYIYGCVCGSADGLLFVRDMGKPLVFSVCNPFTRDYIELELDFAKDGVDSKPLVVVTSGFGASRKTGQRKAVIIYQDFPSINYAKTDRIVCRVYTLETGLWRRVSHVARHDRQSIGVLLNGNLHWLVLDLDEPRLAISCFDLETELFSSFSSPLPGSKTASMGLSVLDDCLCLCDSSSFEGGFDLWFMEEYGVEKSWTKHFCVCNNYNLQPCYFGLCPIKVFEDGDMLMVWERIVLLYYSKKDKIVKFKSSGTSVYAFIHTLSFLSLESFGLKNVGSF